MDEIGSTDVANSKVIEMKLHHLYGNTTHENGIALFKLENSLIFDSRISPICLPSLPQSIPHEGYAFVTGFGKSNGTNTYKLVNDWRLRETSMEMINSDKCEELFANHRTPWAFEWSKYQLICVGSKDHGAHEGDSGGPLVMQASDGRWFQISVTSFTITSWPFAPAAFTDVRKYCDWIEETTDNEVKCQGETVNT